MARLKLCRWNCGRKTDRICGICLQCCNERDEKNKRIDVGLEAYVPPDKRPGHRFHERKRVKRTDGQLKTLSSARTAKSLKQMPQGGGFLMALGKTLGPCAPCAVRALSAGEMLKSVSPGVSSEKLLSHLPDD